jgi:hypothetical protein
LPLAPKSQGDYGDVVELVSLEASDLMRAAWRVTRDAKVITIFYDPGPVRTDAFQWQALTSKVKIDQL